MFKSNQNQRFLCVTIDMHFLTTYYILMFLSIQEKLKKKSNFQTLLLIQLLTQLELKKGNFQTLVLNQVFVFAQNIKVPNFFLNFY
jgi:hypothetical protein